MADLEWPDDLTTPGDANRKEALQRFDITPQAHLTLLPGQDRENYLKQKIKTNYYQFLFTDRATKQQGVFYCGDFAAEGSPLSTPPDQRQEGWLKLAGLERLPRINPLTVEFIRPGNGTNPGTPAAPRDERERVVASLQLVCATAMSVWKMNAKGTAMVDIYSRLCRETTLSSQLPSRIKSINTIISKMKRLNEGEKFHEYLTRLQEKKPEWRFRRFNSELLRELLLTHPKMTDQDPVVF